MKPFFIILIILLVASVQGATVINSRYSSALSAGSADAFTMTMRSDTPAEVGTPLKLSVEGNCSSWITLDKKSVSLTTAGTPITASIKVPSTAANGDYICRVQYTSPAAGMITSRIEVPIRLQVSGGTAPAAMAAAAPSVPTSAAPMQEPTIKPTLKAPEPAIPAAVQEPTIAPEIPDRNAPAVPGYIIGGALLIGVLAFLGVGIFDYWRGKR